MNKQESKKLEQKVLKVLATHLTPEDTIILGLSGGADSVFLLKMLEKFDYQVIPAHLNHCLRPEADSDEKFVKNLAPNLESRKIDLKKQKGNLEANGRQERYKFFRELLQQHQARFILTAHHADDNLETILMNLIRGASLQGLSGMQIQEKDLLRPLLNISKQEILNYLHFYKIPFCKDHSNQDTRYSRNFLRHEIIPKLKKLNPALPETLAQNSQQLREISAFLRQSAQKWLQENIPINLNKFRRLSPVLQKNILREIHHKTIGNTKDLEGIHIEEALQIINKNVGNKRKKMGKLEISIKGGKIKTQLFKEEKL